MNEWAKRFRIGQKSLEGDVRDGRPVEVIKKNKLVLVEDLVVKVKEMAEMIKLFNTTLRQILHDDFLKDIRTPYFHSPRKGDDYNLLGLEKNPYSHHVALHHKLQVSIRRGKLRSGLPYLIPTNRSPSL